MASDSRPHAVQELQACARHLVQSPLTCKEHEPEIFSLIRRHETELDRWFTQRLGYRLFVNADTARLFKEGLAADERPLRTRSGRAFRPLEYVLLALVLGSTVAGPGVTSLRELVERVRSAAVEAGITLEDSAGTRRSLVSVLNWMIGAGLALELYERVDAYAADSAADAIIKVRPERIAMLPLPALAGALNPEDLLTRSERRGATRQWMRAQLLERPVLYRTDLHEEEWAELRRRLGEEERLLDEMFGLVLEVRAEGIAAIDPLGTLAATRFPSGNSIAQAALMLIDRVGVLDGRQCDRSVMVTIIAEAAEANQRRWAADLVAAPERLAGQVASLLVALRLAEHLPLEPRVRASTSWAPPEKDLELSMGPGLRLLPAAARFRRASPQQSEQGAQLDAFT